MTGFLARVARWLGGGFHLKREVACHVAGQSLTVELAIEKRALEGGLAGLGHLDPSRGLLLVLPPQSGQGAISTRRMRFAIDVVFLDNGGHVIDVASCLQPDLPRPGHPVPSGAVAALELVGGRAEELGLKRGVTVPELSATRLRHR